MTTTVQATAEFLEPGSLVVTKTIAGPAAGSQGQVVIHVVCDDGVTRPDFVIPAGAPAGSRFRVYRNIPAGTVCAVVETSNGSVAGTDVVVTGDGQEVTIPAGGRDNVHITDTYDTAPPVAPGSGSLLVTKTIAGPLAGHQGPVTIDVVCNGVSLAPDLVVPPRRPAGSVSQSFDGIPPGSVCTVTETADGATATVAATVEGSGQSVTVSAGQTVPVNVMDVYLQRTAESFPDVARPPSGSLKVTKTIAGPSAGQQGPVAMDVACGGGPLHTFAFRIPAHTGPGPVSRVFPQPPGRGPLHRHRDSRRPHRHGGRDRDQTARGDHTRQRESHRSPDRHLLPEDSSDSGLVILILAPRGALRAAARRAANAGLRRGVSHLRVIHRPPGRTVMNLSRGDVNGLRTSGG